MAMQYPTNQNKSEDLAERVVSQKEEKFKNKKQVLFGGTKSHNQGSVLKLSISLNGVSFMILGFTCYLHEGIALLRRLSRSAFIMTYNKEMLSMFAKKVIELPLYSNDCLIVNAPTISKGYRLLNGKNLRQIN